MITMVFFIICIVKVVVNILEQKLGDCTFTGDNFEEVWFCCDTIQKVCCWFSLRKLLAAYMETIGFRLGESPKKKSYLKGFETLIFQKP